MRRDSKITTRQVSSFSPQAVGVPGQDRSGQIIAQGAMDLGLALKERQGKVDGLAATAKFGDFELAYSEKKAELQQTYRDKPKEYAQAVRSEAQKLVTEHSKDMDLGVKEKFNQITTNALVQDVDNLVNWSIARDQEIIVGNVKKGYNDLALAAETATDPESLTQILGNLEYHSNESKQFISEASDMTLKEAARKDIVESSLGSAMLSNPQKTYADLMKGAYDKSLTPKEVKTLSITAHELMISGAIRENFRTLATASVELSNLTDRVINKETSLADVSRRLAWAELNKDKKDINGQPVISSEYIRGLEGIKKIALGLDSRSATQKTIDERAFSANFERKWDNFLMGRKSKKASPKDYDEVIGMYADLVEARNSGVVDEDVFNNRKKMLDTKLKTNLSGKAVSASLTQALDDAGKRRHWWNNPGDVYSAGYESIRRHVDGRSDMSSEEKIRYRDQLFLSYTEAINKLPADQINNSKQKENTARLILNGTAQQPGLIARLEVYKHPETGDPVMLGDWIKLDKLGGRSAKVIGFNSKTGMAEVGLPKGIRKELDNR